MPLIDFIREMNKANWADWMEPSVVPWPELLANARSFRLLFVFCLAFLFFFSPYIQNGALCGSKWCIFQLLLWNCHFDRSRCCDNSHRINPSKTLNECRVFKHGATAHSAVGVWVKTRSFGGREEGEGGSGEDSDERWGEVWNGTLLHRHARKKLKQKKNKTKKTCVQGGWVTLNWSSPQLLFLFVRLICPFTGQFKVELSQHYIFTSNTTPIFQPWISANIDTNPTSAHYGWHILSWLIFPCGVLERLHQGILLK